MDAKITSTALVVKNEAEAPELYTEGVGFERKADCTDGAHGYVTVGPRGRGPGLALWQEGSPGPTGSSDQLVAGVRAPMVMSVGDVRRTSAELKARGVRFEQEPQGFVWGYRPRSRTRTGTVPRSTGSPGRSAEL
ncbi:MAG: VOC family protein [Nitrososphaerales archaeon]|jgi:hypothetical protein